MIPAGQAHVVARRPSLDLGSAIRLAQIAPRPIGDEVVVAGCDTYKVAGAVRAHLELPHAVIGLRKDRSREIQTALPQLLEAVLNPG